MSYDENEEGGYRPPYVDPLSGITSAFPTVDDDTAAGWTPPPQNIPPQDKNEETAPNAMLGEINSENAYGTAESDVDDAINAVMGMLSHDADETQQGTDPEFGASGEPAPWFATEDGYGVETPSYEVDQPSPTTEIEPNLFDTGSIPGLDRKTAAMAAAMAAMLSDLSRAKPQNNQLPSGQSPVDADNLYGYEDAVGSMMMENGQNEIQQSDLFSAPENVTDIVSEVQGWQGDSVNVMPSVEGVAATDNSFETPAQADETQSVVVDTGDSVVPVEVASVDTDKTFDTNDEAFEKDVTAQVELPQGKETDAQALGKGRKKRAKPKIAKDAQAKGMRGGINFNKTSINVAVQVKTMVSPTRIIPVFLAVAACVGVFTWFGVIKFIGRVDTEQRTLLELEQKRNQLNQAVADFAAVQSEYGLYSSDWMSDLEKIQVNPVQVLAVIENNFLLAARVKRVDLEWNFLTIEFSGVTLNATAGIVEKLEKLEIVREVAVHYGKSVEALSGVITPGGYTPSEPIAGLVPATGNAMNTNIIMEISLWIPGSKEPDNQPIRGNIDAPTPEEIAAAQAAAAQAAAAQEGVTP